MSIHVWLYQVLQIIVKKSFVFKYVSVPTTFQVYYTKICNDQTMTLYVLIYYV